MESCYVEFSPKDDVALRRLESIYSQIRSDVVTEPKPRDNEWFDLFSDEELDRFWWPNQADWKELKTIWGDLPVRFVEDADNPRDDWDLFSMFEAIAQGEYDLLPIERYGDEVYRLNFHPQAYPFGGTESLQKLITSIGGRILAVDDGTGRGETTSKQPPTDSDTESKPWWKLW